MATRHLALDTRVHVSILGPMKITASELETLTAEVTQGVDRLLAEALAAELAAALRVDPGTATWAELIAKVAPAGENRSERHRAMCEALGVPRTTSWDALAARAKSNLDLLTSLGCESFADNDAPAPLDVPCAIAMVEPAAPREPRPGEVWRDAMGCEWTMSGNASVCAGHQLWTNDDNPGGICGCVLAPLTFVRAPEAAPPPVGERP